MSDNEDAERALKPKKRKRSPVKSKDLLSTGSTLLNLACSGRACGGFPKGCYVFLVGDSSSGKTWLSMTCLAEAAINPEFDDYRFIFDNAENGALMDVGGYFGKRVAERLEPPAGTKEDPTFSSTVESFYYHLDDAFNAGKPFIYILDSQDSLTTGDDEEKFQKAKKASRAGKDEAGSYGTSKAKAHSLGMRLAVQKLAKSKSILIVISQTRDKIGFAAMFDPKTRSGGHALKFYAHLEVWSSVKEKLKKKVNEKDRQVGIVSQLKVKKNRLTGKERTVEVDVYHSFGFDDVGTSVDWLVSEKWWKVTAGQIDAGSIGAAMLMSRDRLIKWVEEKGLEEELREAVTACWNDLEEKCQVVRKPRYE